MTAKTDRTYTISQLAREFEVTPRALRFYEDKGLLTPRREGMNRVYSHRDRARLQLILRGKRVGLSLIEIKEILDLYNVDQRAQAQTALKKYKKRIVELEAQREDVDAAIEILHDSIKRLEDFLSKPAPPAAMGAARAFEAEAKKRLEDAH
jgi:DNA-binding transcriptional MerR regulator